MYTIDIDVGGTFTDGFFSKKDGTWNIKVITTPHDLTVCIIECIEEGARQCGLSASELLKKTELIRLSTTIGTNIIVQKKGLKVGLIVTKGFEDSLYGKGGQPPIMDKFIERNMVVGVQEEIDESGGIKIGVKKEDVLNAVRHLVNNGARIIVVSLRRASLNPLHEKEIREIIRERYPEHYLRYVPVQISTEVNDSPDDYERTNTAIVNAYIHREMARNLYKTEDKLKGLEFRRPLLIVHSSGGCARVAKTRAVYTYSSGPASAMMGAATWAKLYGIDNVIATDMGGTTFDTGLIVDGGYSSNLNPQIEGIALSMPMIEMKSIGAGGGSIAKLSDREELSVGPESAGAIPGPAAYDKGGTEPTVTDADLLLGFIDPNYFLGGRIKLNREKAIAAIKRKIAEPLKLDVREAAWRIKERIDRDMAASLEKMIMAKGHEPGNFIMFAFGGAGPVHCCSYGDKAGVARIITFPFGSVFSAFGSSTADVSHAYFKSGQIELFSSREGEFFGDFNSFNSIVQRLMQDGLRDMRGEGFAAEKVNFGLDLILRLDSGVKTCIKSHKLQISDIEDVKAIYFAAKDEARLPKNPVGSPAVDIVLETFILNVMAPIPHPKFPTFPAGAESPERAMKGKREIFWGAEDGNRMTTVYEADLLRCGNVIVGPAVIEARDTVHVIPTGKKFIVDKYLNGIIENT